MVICNLGSPCQLPGNGNEWLLSQSLLFWIKLTISKSDCRKREIYHKRHGKEFPCPLPQLTSNTNLILHSRRVWRWIVHGFQKDRWSIFAWTSWLAHQAQVYEFPGSLANRRAEATSWSHGDYGHHRGFTQWAKCFVERGSRRNRWLVEMRGATALEDPRPTAAVDQRGADAAGTTAVPLGRGTERWRC